MSIQIKGFITRDDFVTPSNHDISPIYEISDSGESYAKRKQILFPASMPTFCLHVFDAVDSDNTVVTVNQIQATSIVRVVSELTTYLTVNTTVGRNQAIINFTNIYNALFPTQPVTNLSFNDTITYNTTRAPDYVTFRVEGCDCAIWLNDPLFRTFYPKYDINIVFPFDNFANTVLLNSTVLSLLENFDPVEFNQRLEDDKAGNPPTVTRILKIPYQVPNTTVTRNCYFGFNVYGGQGNYDYILKLELYRYMTEVLGIPGATVESLFPTILRINEFFVIPRWDRYAIPTQVGQQGINSQITSAYSEVYDITKFVKVFTDNTFIRNNTNNVPVTYNNLNLQVVNGFYTEEPIRDFAVYYDDFISASTMSPDFARMRPRTQRFVTLLETMLYIADSNNQTELFNRVIEAENVAFTIIDRNGVSYISTLYNDHQYYVIPKYEFNRLNQE